MMTKAEEKFENIIDTLVDELIAMPDEQVLNSVAPAAAQSEGRRHLKAAKAQVGRVRLATGNEGRASANTRPVAALAMVTPTEARQFIARVTDNRPHTLAVRSLGDMSDDEAIRLYRKLKALDRGRH